MEKTRLKLIIGLGNPGDEYRNTYHNAGHLALDYFASKLAPDEAWKSPSSGGFSYIKTENLILAKTEGFMNVSGGSVAKACRFFKIEPAELAVAHDDSDQELGRFKLAFDQRSAGHHGIDSIIASLGTQAFWRGKVGIRTVKGKAEHFVLRPISKSNLEELQRVFQELMEKLIEKASP